MLDLREDLSVFDAFYVVLAESRDVPLLTDDGKFARTPNLPAVEQPDARSGHSRSLSAQVAGDELHRYRLGESCAWSSGLAGSGWS